MRVHVHRGARVLDLGCGDGAWTEELLRAGAAEVTGADVAEAALGRARARHPGLRFERVAFDGPLPFERESFDVVWCSETLEHVADTEGFLAEARRVLRPGGVLAVTVPYHGRAWAAVLALAAFERHFAPLGDHLRFYTRRSLADALRDAGFVTATVRSRPPLLLGSAHR